MDRGQPMFRPLLLLIFLSSLSCLAYELALVRIFSITLWYHFAFMVISIAMLGIGASGTLLAVAPALRDLRRVPLYSLLLAISIPCSYLLSNSVPFDAAKLSWDPLQVLYIGLYYLILSAPFLCFGLIVSTAFAGGEASPGAIYASDLLGAGSGSLLMFWLLSLGGPEQVVFLASALLAAALLFTSPGRVRLTALLLLALNVAALLLTPQIIHPRMSPYKPLQAALRFPGAEHLATRYSPYGRIDLFKSPAARYAPGLSLTYLDPLPDQTGISVDGGDIHAITDDKDEKRLAFLNFLPSSLPYFLTKRDDVLVLEPKGGMALLLARQFGSKRITGIESNPLLMRVVEEYRGTAQKAQQVPELRAGLARAWLSSTTRSFDIIDLSSLGSLPSASFSFAEDYRFTREAFTIYLSRLKPGGILSLTLYLLPPPRTELRLFATLVEAAEAMGVRDVPTRFAAIRSWGTLTILYKNGELSLRDIGRIRSFCRERRFDTVLYPGIRPVESNVYMKMPSNEYFSALARLLDPATRSRFLDASLFDIRPVRDDSPFAQYFLKIGNIGAIYRLMDQKWQFFFEEGYILPALFAQVLVISAVLILLPLVALPRAEPHPDRRGRARLLSYFAAIGLGYLFVEIVLIQKMVLVLEHPAYAAGAVIASLLLGSGAGSFALSRIERLRSPVMLLLVALLCVLAVPALSSLAALSALASMPQRIVSVFLAFFPLGFCMGMPLPFGISLLQLRSPALVPWAWAVNGCFSVLSPVLAVMLALATGFTVVLLLAAGLYGAGFLLLRPFGEAR